MNPIPSQRLKRLPGLLYAAGAFAGTFFFFACFIVFLGNLPHDGRPWIRPTVDIGPHAEPAGALIWNAGLVTLFAVQHSLMARRPFKRWLERYLPRELERSTYVHAAAGAGLLLIFSWQPIPLPLWRIENDLAEAVLWTLFGAGWLMLLAGALSVGLLELLGLRQAYDWWRGREPADVRLRTGGLFAYIEHPMYLGVLMGLWATPSMTMGHAILALLFTLYIMLAMPLERRDLALRFGSDYSTWRSPVIAPAHAETPARVVVAARPVDPLTPRMIELLAKLR